MGDLQGTMNILTLFIIWLIPTILFRLVLRNRSGLPPCPLGLPIIGHLHLLAPIPHQALHKLSKRYGPLMHLRLGSVPCVVASSPEMAKEFLKTHENSFSNRPQSAVVDYMTYGSQDFSFAPYGPYWKFMKKLCMSELLGGKTLDLLHPVRRDEMIRFVELIRRKAEAGEAVDVGSELIGSVNNIVSRMLMSKRCCENENEAEDIKELVHEIAEITGKFNVSDYIWFCKNLDLQGFNKRSKDIRGRFDRMIEKIIGEHEEARMMKQMKIKTKVEEGHDEQEVKDLLDILLDISEDQSSNIKLSRENIKAFILDIFGAGTDTSAITIEWALSELINHPDIMEKAVQEIDSVIGNNGSSRVVNESDIMNLPYLQAIVKETLRLHPTGPIILRESSEDCKVGGYIIPAKTQLFVNVWAIGRDPDYWENPLEFRPERFLYEEEENGMKRQQLDVRGQYFHFLPFGSGRRGCPGTSLALQVVQTWLAAMIQCFEWKVIATSDEGNGSKVNMEEGIGLTLPKAHPLVCFPVARHNNPLPTPISAVVM